MRGDHSWIAEQRGCIRDNADPPGLSPAKGIASTVIDPGETPQKQQKKLL
jgi:hypothetical protein